jgi:hypothetical protein
MRFGWSRSSAAEIIDEVPNEHVAGGPEPYDLAAIELLTNEGRLAGWISTDGERTSDWLNQHDELPIHGLTERDQAAAEPSSLPTAKVDLVERDRVVWAVPPPLPPNRHLRLHRRRMLVHLELEHHEVSGQVHVRPGADAADAVLRGTRTMVPLTEVEIVSRHDPDDRCHLPVVIVNATHIRRIVTDVRHQLADVTVSDPVPASEPVALRLEALGLDVPVPETARAPVPPPEPASSAVRASEPGAIEQAKAALMTLLDAGVIDIAEFQAMRLRLGNPSGTTIPG